MPRTRALLVDSLEKVFTDTEPRPLDPATRASVLRGESYSFQIAHHFTHDGEGPAFDDLDLEVAAAGCTVRLARVETVPVQLAALPGHDDDYLRTAPGLYPDLLVPCSVGPDAQVPASRVGLPPQGGTEPGGDGESGVGGEPGVGGARAARASLVNQWQAVWVDVTPHAPGRHPLTVRVTRASDPHTALLDQRLDLDALDAEAPPLGIVNTHWFHLDGLAQYYGVPVFGEQHWHAIDRQVAAAARMGVNSLLTSAWTPPVDTAVGAYRTPTQLIDIEVTEPGRYAFGFDRLRRWADICRGHGITHLEMPHLFSQWGATAAAPFYARVGDATERIFGWETDSTDPRYAEFLGQLLPALAAELSATWSLDRVIFHVSDEPHGPEQLERYRAAKQLVARHLEGVTLVDALSGLEYYESGVVELPAVAVDAIEPFLAARRGPLWAYYCIAQNRLVANRFISQPAYRNLVIAHQLYVHDLQGFLHWGFNFYNTTMSRAPLDPYRDTTAGGAFIGGDTFMVYPGPGGEPHESLRFKVFAQAMRDLRAMQLLETLAGREAVLAIVDPEGTLTFSEYPRDPAHYLRVRAALHAAIAAAR